MTSSLLPILPAVDDILFNFAQSDDFYANLATAFGTNYDVVKATELRQQWQSRNFSQLPPIEVLSGEVLGTAKGAYAVSTNKIYLSESFLNVASSESLVKVILEEIGHYVDAQINPVDTPGDEGAIFAELVQGNSLDVATLDALRAENDSGIITINGKIIQVEQQNLMATAGSVNQSLSFDGVDDYVSNSNVFADVSGTFTMEFWVNPTATRATTPEENSGISGGSGQRYAIFPTHGEAANLGANHFGAGVSVGTNGISVFEHTAYYLPSLLVYDTSLSDWNHVAIVYSNNTPSLYLNGQFIKTGLTSTGIVHPSVASLGGGDATGYGTFQGGLDEVRIWNTARTQTQIQNTLNSQLNGNEIGLVGYYNFNESSGNIAEDGTINNNDGQIFGGLRIDEMYSFADYIGGKYINPSTNLPNLTDYSFNKFTIDQIADGIVSDGYPYNGFASPYSSGTVTLDLVGEFNLTSFFLWNDINVQQEGIKDFRLDFFNKSDVLIDPGFSSVYTAPLGQTAGQEYIFDKVVQGVSRVDLVVLNSQPYTFNHIEIREVGFSGEPDDDVTLPSVTLAVSPSSVTEDGTTNLVYTFTRSGVTTNPLTVNYTVGGTATNGTDYTSIPTTVIFESNSAIATVIVDPTADTTVESNETVALTLATGTGYTVGTTTAVTGTITNDDVTLPSITLAVSPSSVTEDGTANLVYTFTRSGVTTNALTVNYTLGGTATLNTDYTRTGTTNTVTFAANSATATVIVDPTPDTTVENNETVALTLATGTGYTVGTPNAATGTINNDDTSVTLAVSPSSVTEDGTTNLVYTFTRSGVTTNALTVNYTVGGTATNGTDYTSIPTSVTFAANSATATVIVDPTPDTTVENNETVALTLATGTGYTVGTPNAATGTINNDDTSVTLAVSPSSVTEDGTANLVYTFTRSGVTTNALTVNYTIGGTATNGTDYTSIPTSVTFVANSATATVTVDPTADTTVEPDETVALTLATGTGYTIGTPNTATGTITNDDTSVTLAVSPSSVTEDGTANLVYTFTRSGVTTNALTVNYTLGGTATLNTDYTRTGTTNTVTFAANSATATVTVDPTADTTVEPDETVALTLATGTGYTVGTPNAATGTINNDDTSVTLAVSPSSVTEDGTANLVYTFTRSGVTTNALTVNYTIGGTATNGTDYTSIPTSVTFVANSATATVTVDPTADTTVESNETVALTLATGTGYTVGTTTAVTGTITNDDTSVTLAVSPSSVTEDGTTNLVYTFTRSGVTTNALTVNYTLGGTATLNTDYTRTGTNNTVTFAANATTATVIVDPTADTKVEPDETVILTLATGTGYTVGTTTAVTGTINNDDFSQLSINDIITVVEGKDNNAILTVTVDNPNSQQISVNYATEPIDATSNVDYTSQTGTLIIPANTSTATISIPILNDNLNEADEAFTITLSNPVNATINPEGGIGEVIITDTWQSSLTRTLPNNVENLRLIGSNNINGTGNNNNNTITGNSGINQINGANGADILTGGPGADTFIFQFGQSTISTSDRITDFAINSDKIDLLTQGGNAMNAPSSFSRAANSTATTLQNLVNQVFTDANGATTGNQGLGVNSAALVQVTTGAIAGTYLIINDSTDGFQSSNDLLINITGFTGSLPALGSITVGNFFV